MRRNCSGRTCPVMGSIYRRCATDLCRGCGEPSHKAERKCHMKQQSSQSAAGVALLRAIEAEKPEGVRICDDPYARSMANGGIAFTLSKLVIKAGLYERMAPGAESFIVVRERYIDDFLKA